MKTIGKSFFAAIILLFNFLSTINSQTLVDTCIIIKTDGDAFVLDRPTTQNTNYGSYQDVMAVAWTYSGDPAYARSLIHFDLSSIPASAVITSANLSLYYHVSPHGNGDHSGANICYVQRVTSNWLETTVTWNNQPTTTTVNQLLVPASSSPTQDYLNLNISGIMQDIVSAGANNGIMLRLQTESPLSRVVFASKEEPDTSLHPTLEICYQYLNTGLEEQTSPISITTYPNPTSDFLNIQLGKLTGNSTIISYNICNIQGESIQTGTLQLNASPGAFTVNCSDLKSGTYFIKIQTDSGTAISKLIKM